MNATQPFMESLPEPERIRAIRSLRRENKVQDALALLKQQAKYRLDVSEQTQDQLLHLEAECHQDSSDDARAVATYDRIVARRGDSVAPANREVARAVELDPKNRVARPGESKMSGNSGCLRTADL